MPSLHLVVVPHPFDTLSVAERIAIADEFLDQALAAIAAGALESTLACSLDQQAR